jgi:hypothetical protein
VPNIFCTILTYTPLRQFRTRTEGLWSRLGGSVDNGRRYGKTQAAMTLATNIPIARKLSTSPMVRSFRDPVGCLGR